MGIVMCMNCMEVLHSKYRHDFQQCHCENETFIDGGSDYQRIGGKDIKLIKVLNLAKK